VKSARDPSTLKGGGDQGVATDGRQLDAAVCQVVGVALPTVCRCHPGGSLVGPGLQIRKRGEAVDRDRRVAAVVPGESDTHQGRRSSKHVSWRRLLSAAQLRQIPNGWAVLIYLNEAPRMLREPLAAKRHQFSRHIALRSVEEMRAGWREPRRRPSVVPVRATAVAVRGRAGSGLLRPLLWALLVVAIVVALIALRGASARPC
jgi:hypothetical protein